MDRKPDANIERCQQVRQKVTGILWMPLSIHLLLSVLPSCYFLLNHWAEFNQTCYKTSPYGNGVWEQHYFVCLFVHLIHHVRPFVHHAISSQITGQNLTKPATLHVFPLMVSVCKSKSPSIRHAISTECVGICDGVPLTAHSSCDLMSLSTIFLPCPDDVWMWQWEMMPFHRATSLHYRSLPRHNMTLPSVTLWNDTSPSSSS